MVKVDARIFERKLRAQTRARHAAREEALEEAMHELGTHVLRTAPRDTNRYVRGAMQAFNDMGAGPLPVPHVQRGQRHAQYRRRLEAQIRRRAEQLEDVRRVLEFWYPKGPPKRPRTDTYRRLVRDERYYAKQLARAEEELAQLLGAEHGAILIGGRKTKRGRGNITVRTKLYGGEGRIYHLGPKAFAEVRIKEPHARFVERRYRVFRDGTRTLKSTGLKRASKRYRKTVAAAAGMPLAA